MSYSTLTYSPNEILTSAKMNQASDNDEALRDGTGIDDDAIITRHVLDGQITKAKIALAARGLQLIGEHVLSSAADALTVSSIPARRRLVIVCGILNSGSVNTQMKFNNDGGNNYSQRFWTDMPNAAAATITSGAIVELEGASGSRVEFHTFDVLNVATFEKVGVQNTSHNGGATGAATAPGAFDNKFKWANTSVQINRVDILNAGSGATGDFAAGSFLQIWAAEE